MNRLCPLLILLGLFLSASAPRTAGQETQSAPTQRLIVLTVQDLSGPSSTHGYDQPITDAVAAAFAAGGAYQIVPTAEWQAAAQAKSLQPRDMMAGSTAAAFGRATGAALVVSGAYAVVPMGSDEQIALTLQCWDAATGALRAGLQRTARFDLSFYLELQDWVAALGQSLQSGEAVPTQAQDALPPPAPSQITFLSHDEAMEVLLGGDTSAGFVANGRLVFPINGLKDGTVFSVTKRKPGYHESVQAVKAAPQVLLTPLAREHPGAVEVFLTTGQVLGLGAAVRGYGIPDWFYASLGTYAYVQTPQVAALRYVFHDDISFRMGSYLFFPPEFPVRFSLSAGAGMILSVFSQPGLPLYTDSYLDVASWSLETRVLGPVLFLRQDFVYTTGVGQNLTGRGWTIRGFPPTTVGVMFQ